MCPCYSPALCPGRCTVSLRWTSRTAVGPPFPGRTSVDPKLHKSWKRRFLPHPPLVQGITGGSDEAPTTVCAQRVPGPPATTPAWCGTTSHHTPGKKPHPPTPLCVTPAEAGCCPGAAPQGWLSCARSPHATPCANVPVQDHAVSLSSRAPQRSFQRLPVRGGRRPWAPLAPQELMQVAASGRPVQEVLWPRRAAEGPLVGPHSGQASAPFPGGAPGPPAQRQGLRSHPEAAAARAHPRGRAPDGRGLRALLPAPKAAPCRAPPPRPGPEVPPAAGKPQESAERARALGLFSHLVEHGRGHAEEKPDARPEGRTAVHQRANSGAEP